MSYPCPICYNKNTYLKNARMSLYKCDACDHTFTIIPKDEEEPYNENYFIETHKNWFANPDTPLFEYCLNVIKEFLKGKKIKMLDVGCGTGSFLKHIHKIDPSMDLTGMDFVTNESPGIKFIAADFLTWDVPEKYNAITNFMVIEHVPDPHLFVKKMHDALTDDGILIVNTIHNNSIIYKLARALNGVGFSVAHDRLYDHHHLQHYSNQSLKKVIEMEGMEVFKIRNHNYKLKAVDVPSNNPVVSGIYKFATLVLFGLSKPFNAGHHQTLFCRKKK